MDEMKEISKEEYEYDEFNEPALPDDYDKSAAYGEPDDRDDYYEHVDPEGYDENVDYGAYRTRRETREDRYRVLEENDDEYDEDGTSIVERRMMGYDYDEIEEERMLESDGYVDWEAQFSYEPEPDEPDTFMNGVALNLEDLPDREGLEGLDGWDDPEPSYGDPDELGF